MENKKTTSTKKLQAHIVSQLVSVPDDTERQSIASIVLEEVLGLSRTDWVLDQPVSVGEDQSKRLQEIVERLNNEEPIQYILGNTEFFGLVFAVSPVVLIPRPETEELVAMIIKENANEGLKVLDIGTGSGCIPISLKKNMPNASVYALDISEDALAIAKNNAIANGATIDFLACDILSEPLSITGLDIIVSNPPYVLESEKKHMHGNVLRYEPAQALFVHDNDPLLFYKKIALIATKSLSRGGKLYFEINERYGIEVAGLLEQKGFGQVRISEDLQGKERMVTGVWGD